jgi:hypothetical protein
MVSSLFTCPLIVFFFFFFFFFFFPSLPFYITERPVGGLNDMHVFLKINRGRRSMGDADAEL